jgi:hypothetical protein
LLSEVLLNRISHAAYAAVRAWDMDHDADLNVPLWSEVDDETREAVTKRVNAILSDPRAGDATFHNKWLTSRKESGWSSGREFDEARKVDPLCVPFHLLPPEMQARERLFRAVTLSLSRV